MRRSAARPLDPNLAVFAAYWGAAYSCNPRAIYEKARELAPWIRGVWVVKRGSEHVLPDGVEYVVEGSSEYYRLMARATYFVNNVNFPNDIVKRRGQVHLQTHHGTPLKTMGMDLVNAKRSSLGLNFRRLMTRVARWDYSMSANEFSTEIWERVYPSGTYESLETGYPRNDVLATATAGAPRPGARRAGHRAGPAGGALHADAPRVHQGVRAARRPRRAGRRAPRALRRPDARALLLRRRRRVRAPGRG